MSLEGEQAFIGSFAFTHGILFSLVAMCRALYMNHKSKQSTIETAYPKMKKQENIENIEKKSFQNFILKTPIFTAEFLLINTFPLFLVFKIKSVCELSIFCGLFFPFSCVH